MHRRSLLLGALAAAATSCVRPRPRAEPASPTSFAEGEAWNDEARGILRAALEVLRTFDTYAAYRISAAESSLLRSSWEFRWDPPSALAWEAATEGVERLRERAARLHGAVATSLPDPTLWRERRALADATLLLRDMSDALGSYRSRVNRIPPEGDGSGALLLLQWAWELWSQAADHWGVSRFETITCG